MKNKVLSLSLVGIFICLFNSINAQEIKLISIENNFCRPLKLDSDIIIKYKTFSCGTVSGFLKGKYDDFVLFKDKKEFYGIGNIYISSDNIIRWMDYYSFRSLTEANILLTHVSCRNNRYSQTLKKLHFDISAPYGYKLMDYPSKPDVLPTNLKLRIKKVNPASFLYFILGVGLSIGGISYAVENDIFGSEDNSGAITTGLLLGGGIGFISLGADNYYKYSYISDTHQNNENYRINQYNLSNWQNQCSRIDKQNELIRNTFTIKIKL